MATVCDNRAHRGKGYARRISSHLAAALVVFCLSQIFIVARMGGSLLLHLGVIVAIGGFALAARTLERRWQLLDGSGLAHRDLDPRFRRDVLYIWSVSILGALLWIPVAIIYRFFLG